MITSELGLPVVKFERIEENGLHLLVLLCHIVSSVSL